MNLRKVKVENKIKRISQQLRVAKGEKCAQGSNSTSDLESHSSPNAAL